jgi:hypothetical protein
MLCVVHLGSFVCFYDESCLLYDESRLLYDESLHSLDKLEAKQVLLKRLPQELEDLSSSNIPG